MEKNRARAIDSVRDLQNALQSRIDGDVSFDRFARAMHATDASVYQILPRGVVAPRSRDDVIQVVSLCRQYAVPITARGGGTSQAGQAIGAGISLDFSRYMNRLLELNVEAQTVWVEPGIVLDELNLQLKPHGLQLPLDLSTSNRATIGGMIANNSAGTRSIIYGKTLDFVEELEVVLADGSVVRIGPIDAEELAAKEAQTDLEGRIYRTVRELGDLHQDEIRRRYPRILRRVGGYNLDEFLPPIKRFNLARMLVGSEGTLALTLAAKMRLVPVSGQRVVCSVEFDELLEAMAATPIILEHGPSAVELIDRFILSTTQGRIEYEPLRSFIAGDPAAVLLVEFMGEDKAKLVERLDKLEAALAARGLGYHVHRAIDPAAQARIWELRRAALGLTMSETGDAKSISFVEDTAVAPEKLRDYIESFQAILAKYETPAGFYAHASVGLLHIRPAIDMKTSGGVERFAAIAAEVSDLVLEYGGALSGEHGDGLVRAPFQEKMFGPVLYDAFRQIKRAFDPDGLFNPGKIVDAPALTDNLRYGAGYQTPQFETAFDFSDYGGLLRATEQCSGVGDCRKTLTGTMCPSYMATRNETDSTRGRANALRLALSGRLDSPGFGDEELLPVLDLCLECKACKRECPTSVDMARMKSEFLHQHHRKHGVATKEQVLARVEQIALWGSRLAPVSNWLAAWRPVAGLNQRLLGLDRRRPLPRFSRRTFVDNWQPRPRQDAGSTAAVLFIDTFNNFFEPEHLIAAAALIERQGGAVHVPPRICCGRPFISKGLLDQARSQALATMRTLLPLVEKGLPILFCEPSCYSAVRDDHPHLLRGADQRNAQRVADACLLIEEWVGPRSPTFEPGPRRVLVHGHCHQKALVGVDPLVKLLQKIPGCRVEALDSGCCGLAGLFGYEHYDISRAIGERRLFPAVRGLGEGDVMVSPGFSCRQQIHHFTGVVAHSPMSLLQSL
ncbi:MAG TPA: FAD-linked oxidase C-terminal domain-containing protein [Anaerolineales bacterium]